MSLLIYAGSMQYVAIGWLTDGALLITAAITTLMVNARHLFYGSEYYCGNSVLYDFGADGVLGERIKSVE